MEILSNILLKQRFYVIHVINVWENIPESFLQGHLTLLILKISTALNNTFSQSVNMLNGTIKRIGQFNLALVWCIW